MRVCMHAWHVCLFVCLYVCMCVCFYVCTFVCLYVCMYVSIYVCMYVRMYVRMYVCRYRSPHIYICIYTYIFTQFAYIYLYKSVRGLGGLGRLWHATGLSSMLAPRKQLFTAEEPLGSRKHRSSLPREPPALKSTVEACLGKHFCAQKHCSSLLREPLGAQKHRSSLLHEPLGAQKRCSSLLQEPLYAEKHCSSLLQEPLGAQKCCSTLSTVYSMLKNAVQNHCSRKLHSGTLNSVPLRLAPLCSVHGYARVHTSMYIYIYMCVCVCM